MTVLRLDENYLEFNIQTLTALGMWKPRLRNRLQSIIYNWYAIGLFCFAGIPQTIAKAMHAWKNRNTMVMFTQHFTIVTGMASTLIKIANLWHRRRDVEELIDLLNYERRMPCNLKFAVRREKIVTSTIRVCKLFSLTFIIMIFWYAVFIYGRIVVCYKGNIDVLPLSPLVPLRSNNTIFYWSLFVYDEMTFFYIAGTVASHDSLFMVFLIHLGTQLDLLKERLTLCHDEAYNAPNVNYIEQDNDFSNLAIECVRRTQVQESMIDPLTELRACIEHHQQILKYVSLVQNIFNHTLLLQFASSLVMITMIGFQMSDGRQLSNSEFVEHSTLLLCALFQLLLYCWFGTVIITKSDSLNFAAYRSVWYVADEPFKSALKILMCKGQKPIKIRVGYVFEVSSSMFMNASKICPPLAHAIHFLAYGTFTALTNKNLTFSQIVSKCYSAMALLQQVNE